MYGAEALTHFVYGFIVLSLIVAFGFAAFLSLRQKRKLAEMERGGYRPQSVQESIVMSQKAEANDARRKR